MIQIYLGLLLSAIGVMLLVFVPPIRLTRNVKKYLESLLEGATSESIYKKRSVAVIEGTYHGHKIAWLTGCSYYVPGVGVEVRMQLKCDLGKQNFTQYIKMQHIMPGIYRQDNWVIRSSVVYIWAFKITSLDACKAVLDDLLKAAETVERNPDVQERLKNKKVKSSEIMSIPFLLCALFVVGVCLTLAFKAGWILQ